MFGSGFKASKLKAHLQLSESRIKVIRTKKQNQLVHKRREIAELLRSGQEPRARIRVEDLIREESTVSAYDILELYCELLVTRMPIIETQKACPPDLKEAVASLIFAAPRSADLQELMQARNLFAAKYGKDFLVAAEELRPDCGVSRTIIQKLSVRTPSAEEKLKVLQAIAQEHNLDWDSSSYARDIRDQRPDFADLGHSLSIKRSEVAQDVAQDSSPNPVLAPLDYDQAWAAGAVPKAGTGAVGTGDGKGGGPKSGGAGDAALASSPAPAEPGDFATSAGGSRATPFYPSVPSYQEVEAQGKGPTDYPPSVAYRAVPRSHAPMAAPAAGGAPGAAPGAGTDQGAPPVHQMGGEVAGGDESSHASAFERRRREREEQMRAIVAAGERARAAADKAARAAEGLGQEPKAMDASNPGPIPWLYQNHNVEPPTGGQVGMPAPAPDLDLELRFKRLTMADEAQPVGAAPAAPAPGDVSSFDLPTPPQGFMGGGGAGGKGHGPGGPGGVWVGEGGNENEKQSGMPLPSPPKDFGSFKPPAGVLDRDAEGDMPLPSPPEGWGAPVAYQRPQAALPPPPPPPQLEMFGVPPASDFDDFIARGNLGSEHPAEALPNLNDLKARFDRLRQRSSERSKISGY